MGFFRKILPTLAGAATSILAPSLAPTVSNAMTKLTQKKSSSGGTLPVSGQSRSVLAASNSGGSGGGGGTSVSTGAREFYVNLLEYLLAGATDKMIRARWQKRPSDANKTAFFEWLVNEGMKAMGNAETVLVSNEFEKILRMKRRRNAVPKFISRFVKQARAIQSVVTFAHKVKARKGGRR